MGPINYRTVADITSKLLKNSLSSQRGRIKAVKKKSIYFCLKSILVWLRVGWCNFLGGKKKSNNNPPSMKFHYSLYVSSLDPYCSHGNTSHVTLTRAVLSAGLYLMECSECACEWTTLWTVTFCYHPDSAPLLPLRPFGPDTPWFAARWPGVSLCDVCGLMGACASVLLSWHCVCVCVHSESLGPLVDRECLSAPSLASNWIYGGSLGGWEVWGAKRSWGEKRSFMLDRWTSFFLH